MNDPLNIWQPGGADTENVDTQGTPVRLRHPSDQQAVKDQDKAKWPSGERSESKADAIRIRRKHKKRHNRPGKDNKLCQEHRGREKTVVKDTDKAKWPSGVSPKSKAEAIRQWGRVWMAVTGQTEPPAEEHLVPGASLLLMERSRRSGWHACVI